MNFVACIELGSEPKLIDTQNCFHMKMKMYLLMMLLLTVVVVKCADANVISVLVVTQCFVLADSKH